jgi:ribosomal protein L24E
VVRVKRGKSKSSAGRKKRPRKSSEVVGWTKKGMEMLKNVDLWGVGM